MGCPRSSVKGGWSRLDENVCMTQCTGRVGGRQTPNFPMEQWNAFHHVDMPPSETTGPSCMVCDSVVIAYD